MLKKKCPQREKYLAGKRIIPKGITGKEKFPDLLDDCFLAYNSARLREVCRLYTERMLEQDVTLGMSLSGALTPAGNAARTSLPQCRQHLIWA